MSTIAFSSVFGELEAGQLHGVGDHRERDLLRAGVLHAGPEDPGRERGAEADAREVGDESSSGFLLVGHGGECNRVGPAAARRAAKAGGSGRSGGTTDPTPQPHATMGVNQNGQLSGFGKSVRIGAPTGRRNVTIVSATLPVSFLSR